MSRVAVGPTAPKDRGVTRKAWIGVGVGVLALAGALFLWDVLVVTDEERLELFVEDVTGDVGPDRVMNARVRWVDLDRQPLEISAMGRSLLYRAGEDDALQERSQTALRSMYGERLRALTSGITVDGERATVTLRLMGDRSGLHQVQWRLRKRDDEWLVERLAVTR